MIRLGDEIKNRVDTNEVRGKIQNLHDFILTVGTVEHRKNHIVFLNAYRLLVSEGSKILPLLVIVGREGFMNNNLVYQVEQDPLLKNKVIILNKVSDTELYYLYENCLFTAYPALYEGWGLPVAESLRHGKQCICSGTSSLLEIAPDITRFAHPLKASEWAKNIFDLYNTSAVLEEETNKVINNYKGTSWAETSAQLIKIIREGKEN